jgi:hypothetical protein
MNERERWGRYADEFLKFDRVEPKKSNRADLHAFLLLDEVFPGKGDIVAAASHDEIWLGVDLHYEGLSPLTDEQVLELVRCGVRYSDGSLCMFV